MQSFLEQLKLVPNTLKGNKQFVFIAIPFGLILLFIVIFIFQIASPQTTQVAPNPTPSNEIIPSSDDDETAEEGETFTEEKLLENQEKFEQEYAEEQAAILRAYPWYDKLPLQEPRYFVYFDVDTETFVGLLYPRIPSRPSSIPIDQQVETMKQEITTILTNLGIDYSQYPFDWQVTPEE